MANIHIINGALQSLAEETGHPNITNYKIASEFIADEAVRVMVPTGSAALAASSICARA